MAINSLEFFAFFSCVASVYFGLFRKSARFQNLWLLLASYTYYSLADLNLVPFLAGVTLVFYILGRLLPNAKSNRQSLFILLVGVVVGLGTLIYFKYLNFIVMTTANLFHLGGENGEPGGLGILVPLGVSFFTFRLISYVLDVYREKIEPTRDFVAFANYIAFFPCLLAGPIDRPSGFLQQIQRPRKLRFDSVANGTRQVLWGMLKKVVIADNLAAFVDGIWRNKLDYPSVVLFLCAGLYAFQMYTDFSGYSDMAIGVSKILGIQVSPNFRYPFFALNISDYWRRWHISLTSWLTDYVFLPLNVQFRNWGKVGLSIAIVLDLVLVGTWHGANWTYVLFGLYHGLLFLPLIVSGAFFKKTSLETGFWGLPKFKSAIRMLITFSLVSIGLILFRAPNIELAGKYLVGLASLRSTFSEGLDKWNVLTKVELRIGLLFVILLTIIEWYQRDREYGLDLDTTKIPVVWRWGIYYLAVIVLVLFGSSGKSGFIYAQF